MLSWLCGYRINAIRKQQLTRIPPPIYLEFSWRQSIMVVETVIALAAVMVAVATVAIEKIDRDLQC
ncbi:hypothetical protein QUA47_30480 [Microcoleus sp. MON2_D5]